MNDDSRWTSRGKKERQRAEKANGPKPRVRGGSLPEPRCFAKPKLSRKKK